jgi:hypothetical protein
VYTGALGFLNEFLSWALSKPQKNTNAYVASPVFQVLFFLVCGRMNVNVDADANVQLVRMRTLQCPSCPDPPTCARLLDEKWRQAYQAVFRFGPCQPSMVFRYLRTLEGVSPPLALSHLTCQTTAKAFIATRAWSPTNNSTPPCPFLF